MNLPSYAVEAIIRDAREAAQYAAECVKNDAALALNDIRNEAVRPSVLLRPSIQRDGNQWCALYGENLQDGTAGYGDSPAEAFADFDRNFAAKIPPAVPGGAGCTGTTARWCPVHGDCTCPRPDLELDAASCPLHAPGSEHGEPPRSLAPSDTGALALASACDAMPPCGQCVSCLASRPSDTGAAPENVRCVACEHVYPYALDRCPKCGDGLRAWGRAASPGERAGERCPECAGTGACDQDQFCGSTGRAPSPTAPGGK
jgi:hypothetical protein